MSTEHKDNKAGQFAHDSENARVEVNSIAASDEAALARLGYKQEFKREFTSLSTISFAFSIMGVASTVPSTLNTPLLSGGPAAVVWCWLIGSCFCFCLGTSIAEIVSAYPCNGGLYSASAYLVPRKYRAIVGWCVGWLNLLGQISGVASTEWGLAGLILAAATVSTDGNYVATAGHQYGVFAALLVIHGILNSVGTKLMSRIASSFVFINLGTVVAIIIALLVTTKDKHPGSYVFTEVVNQTGWSSTGLAFLFGLLSVQWTMTDYDATAHISEEVRRASFAAPVAIFVAGTGIFGWVYNIVWMVCSGDLTALPGPSGYATATILSNNVGKTGFYILWAFVCLTSFTIVTTALQANARTFHAFSRDHGLPDRGLFARLAPNKVPVYAVWLVVAISAVLCVLVFASYVAVNAVFALCVIALDSSYVIPIACKVLFRDHPEVQYVEGPFTLGRGLKQKIINYTAIGWTSFVVVILALPEVWPVTGTNMNYAGPVVLGVLFLALVWYFLGGRKHYHGPINQFEEEKIKAAKSGAPALSSQPSSLSGTGEDVAEDKKEI